MNMDFIRKLPIPKEIKEQYPITEELARLKAERDVEIKKIFSGESDKFLLVIGPCSADSEDSVLDYISRLRGVQEKVKDKIMIVPRIYTGKPRTTGDGYKGMLHQPNPNEKPDLIKGIIAIRELHMRALRETGFSCADEMLYPENHRYLNDLLSYVAVGARSVEDQQHRLTASGLDIPYAHAILRGYVDERGNSFPNYHYEDLLRLAETYAEKNLQNKAVVIDTNHSNSGKKYIEQIRIAKEILHSCRHNAEIKKIVKGLMIESYLEEGSQKIEDPYIYGKSITDPCLGWEDTEKLIYEIAEKC